MAVVDDAASLFRAADGAATLALLAKLTVEAAQQCKMEEARNKLQVRCSSGAVCSCPQTSAMLHSGFSHENSLAFAFPENRGMGAHIEPCTEHTGHQRSMEAPASHHGAG